uniref:CHRD domain-containing protein n=1 Tax=Pithovirus LCPAC406 TaxID=2506599 RepID=A0A481ZDW1_9VIRU|nr:MAG: uncharacterized protein LCPAC406_02910 [Pithovirus LCPAC406]
MNNFTAALSSNQSTASGLAAVSLTGNSLFWNISWSGLSSVNAVFFLDSSSNVQVDAGTNSNQNIPYDTALVGSAPLLLGGNQVQQLLMGTWSLQISTDSFPNGEIMGKVIPNIVRKHHKPHNSRRGDRRKKNLSPNHNNSQMNQMMRANQQQRRAKMNGRNNHNSGNSRRTWNSNKCPDCGDNHDDDESNDDDESSNYDTE